jgi:hypothetical protein
MFYFAFRSYFNIKENRKFVSKKYKIAILGNPVVLPDRKAVCGKTARMD